MKKLFIISLTLFVSLIAITGCFNDSTASKSKIEDPVRAQFIADSLAKEKAKLDSINAITVTRLKPFFTEKKDEFSDITWIEPKSAPKYRNMNGTYCYFAKKGEKVENFRFVFQYYADDWLFIESMIFNIDGENITISPSMDTDCGYGGKIWEWCDTQISLEFVEKLANAKSVKIKMNGSQYYDTRTLTTAQIQSIKNTYDYFKALGGES